MPSLNRNEKVQCGDCGTMYVRAHAARHRKNCSIGVISCQEGKYLTYNQQEMNYHVAKSMLHQLPSNQPFVRLARRSFRVTTLSNNIGEKNMGQNNGSQVTRW